MKTFNKLSLALTVACVVLVAVDTISAAPVSLQSKICEPRNWQQDQLPNQRDVLALYTGMLAKVGRKQKELQSDIESVINEFKRDLGVVASTDFDDVLLKYIKRGCTMAERIDGFLNF